MRSPERIYHLGAISREALITAVRWIGALAATLVFVWAMTGAATAAPAGQTSDACTAGLDAFYAGDDAAALPLLEAGFATLDPATAVIEDADCAMVLCSLRRTDGRVDDAIAACTVAVTIIARLDDPLRLSIVEFTLGDAYRSLGDLAHALAAYQRSLDAARRAEDGVGITIALTRIADVYRDQGRLADAEEAYSLARETARDLGVADGEQTALAGLGQVYKSQGRYAEAEEALTAAWTLAQELGDRLAEGFTRVYLGGVDEARGRYAEATGHYTAALAIGDELRDDNLRMAARGGLGSVAWDQGYYADALAAYTEALALAQGRGDTGSEGHYLNNIGLVHLNQGRYGEAAALFAQALDLARATGDLDEEAAALHNLGRVLNEQGRLAEARARYEQALAIVQTAGYRAEESIVLNSIASVLLDQGRESEALAWYQAALDLARELGSAGMEGNVLNNMGLAYEMQERYDDAVHAYLAALAISQTLGELGEQAKRLNNVAGMAAVVGEVDAALEYYRQAVELERELGRAEGEAAALNNVAAVYYTLAQDADALTTVQEALTLARTVDNPTLLGRILANAARVQAGLGDLEAAVASVEEAMTLVDTARAVAGSEAGRAAFAERFIDVYSLAVGLYHRSGRDVEAFVAGERGRARAFLDALATGEIQLSDSQAAALLSEQRELYAQWLAAQDALAARAAQQPPDPDAIAQAAADLAVAEQAYQTVLVTIEAQAGELTALIPGRSQLPDLAAIQALLDDQTTLVSFYVLPDEEGSLAFVIGRDTFRVVALPDATGTRLTAALMDLTLWLDLDAPHPQPLVDLHAWLIAPLLPWLTTPMLGIVPHQMLHYAPLAALSDGATYLGDRFTLFWLPSVAALPYIRANAATGDGTGAVLVYGNPATDARLALLLHAEEEARAISDLLAAPVYTGAEANESLLVDQAGTARILHLAAHGAYNRANPLYSAIYLAPDQAADGRLEVHEVYGLDLAANELVVLSACETSLGRLSAGDELVGLTRAFFFAGAPTVIASLWTVDDLATRDLMLAFYSGLDAGMGKAAALQAAQASLRSVYPSPYYWAAFVLNGDPGLAHAAQPVEVAAGPAAPVTTRGGQGAPPPATRAAGPVTASAASSGWLDDVVRRIGKMLR